MSGVFCEAILFCLIRLSKFIIPGLKCPLGVSRLAGLSVLPGCSGGGCRREDPGVGAPARPCWETWLWHEHSREQGALYLHVGFEVLGGQGDLMRSGCMKRAALC